MVGGSVLAPGSPKTLRKKRFELCVRSKASLAHIDHVNCGVAAWFFSALVIRSAFQILDT